MKIFIYEYLCGGGLEKMEGHESLLDEGKAMLAAALADFDVIDGVSVFSMVDKNFNLALSECDAALVIAPECGGRLLELTKAVINRGKLNLGCDTEAIKIAGDKYKFATVMETAGIPHPRTFIIDERFNHTQCFNGSWVAKPVDGAGCDNVTFHKSGEVENCVTDASMIAQEYIPGAPMSLSVLSGESASQILSVNRQIFSNDMKYEGGETLGVAPDRSLCDLVDRVKSAIPGLKGYWGLDYIDTSSGPVVIEVNPRLTTSYCALSSALDMNPAEAILDCFQGRVMPVIKNRKAVRFNLLGEIAVS